MFGERKGVLITEVYLKRGSTVAAALKHESLPTLLKGIVRESGAIAKCFDEMCEDFLISDELRKVQSIQ